jgi:hypothetical protein
MQALTDLKVINALHQTLLFHYPDGYIVIRRGRNGRFIAPIIVPKEES